MAPTMVAYLASRDVMRMRAAEWHETYTLPTLWDFYQSSRDNHGSYYFDWTTWDEVAWKNFYRVWMQFLNDYKNAGGRVTASSDAGFIYNLFGFGTIQEMELLQEAGFHPLEVIRSATMHAAEPLFEPKGQEPEFGIVREDMLADLVIVGENPIANLKVLFGTGAVRLNDETGEPERVGGIVYTIKDGIVYDAKALLQDVARMVEKQKGQSAKSCHRRSRQRPSCKKGVDPGAREALRLTLIVPSGTPIRCSRVAALQLGASGRDGASEFITACHSTR